MSAALTTRSSSLSAPGPSQTAIRVMKALGDPTRLRLFYLLTVCPMAVGDLVATLGLSQALVSHHLATLKAARLVIDHRAADDARSIIYMIDTPSLTRLRHELSWLMDPIKLYDPRQDEDIPRRPFVKTGPIRVLFLCTGNSARSQIAEAWLRKHGEGLFEAYSAGVHPKGLNPLTVKIMQESGIDVSHHLSKSVDEFRGQSFDYVITVCDQANEECPIFPDDHQRIHWSIEDPAAAEGTEAQRLAVFRRIANELSNRIALFVNVNRRDALKRMATPIT